MGGTRDKAILLNFWASWCEPCKQEAPELNAIAEKYKDSLAVYGVNVTKYDTKKNAQKFVDKYGVQFPVMFDLKADIYEKQYKGVVFPTNVLIDKRGVVQEVVLGILPQKDLEKKVKKLINS
ncbi:Thiol-disulfide oxidoreductase ResA [Paenibacillus sp. P1XP2]|nr:Thiol-disulfide oxidoreductase ResA [Paenibacillus sp. P1XP2]